MSETHIAPFDSDSDSDPDRDETTPRQPISVRRIDVAVGRRCRSPYLRTRCSEEQRLYSPASSLRISAQEFPANLMQLGIAGRNVASPGNRTSGFIFNFSSLKGESMA